MLTLLLGFTTCSVPAFPRRDTLLMAAAAIPVAATMSSAPDVNWGIVGLGDVTAKKSGPPFWKCSGSKLTAVMRRTPGAASTWIRDRVPNPAYCTGYDSLDAFLAHPELDAVYIATPPGSHLEIAAKVAAAGKHCYIEKPCGRCGYETAAIQEAFQTRDLKLFTAYISRAYPRTEAVRSLLAGGAVGERVTEVSYTLRGTGGARGLEEDEALPWRLDAAQSGGGLIMDVGCHVIDRIDFLLGPLVSVSGRAENRNSPRQAVEDFVSLQATVGAAPWAAVRSEGASVSMVWDFSPRADASEGEGPVDLLVITGSNGSLEMAAMSPSAPISVLDAAGKLVRQLAFEQPEHTAQALIQSATDELRGVLAAQGGAAEQCPSRGENAVRASDVLDAALDSYYGGRNDGYWKRPEAWPGNRRDCLRADCSSRRSVSPRSGNP